MIPGGQSVVTELVALSIVVTVVVVARMQVLHNTRRYFLDGSYSFDGAAISRISNLTTVFQGGFGTGTLSRQLATSLQKTF